MLTCIVTLSSFIWCSGANAAPTAGIYSGKREGRIEGPPAQLLVEGFRAACQARGGTFQLDGDPAKAGTVSEEFYVSPPRSATYINTAFVAAPERGDPCLVRLLVSHRARFETFVQGHLETVSVDLDRGKGDQRSLDTPDSLQADVTQRKHELLGDGWSANGTQQFAGYRCVVLTRTTVIGAFELCLLEDPSAPAFAQGIALHDMNTLAAAPGKRNERTVTRIEFGKPFDPTFLEVPPTAKIRILRGAPKP